MDKNNELLPCPFCGGQPKEQASLGVWCDHDDCAIVGQVFSGGASHWNRRAPSASAQQADADSYDLPEEQRRTLHELLACCLSWEPSVRILGNVRADQAAAAITAAILSSNAATPAPSASPHAAKAANASLIVQVMREIGIDLDDRRNLAEHAAKRLNQMLHLTDKAEVIPFPSASPAALTDAKRIADVLLAAWQKAEPNHSVSQYPESYKATFLDMARALLAASPADQGDKPCGMICANAEQQGKACGVDCAREDARDALMLELLESYEAIFRSAYCQLDADDDLIRRVRAAMSASKEGA